jgi:Skp family chaperone for outer membrane proteins
MKNNLALILSSVAVVIAVYGLFKSNGGEHVSSAVSEGFEVFSSNDGTSNIYYVNLDSVARKYKLVKNVQEELIADQRKYEQQLQSRIEGFRARYEKLQEESAYMTRAELERAQDEIQHAEMEIQELQQQLSVQLAQKEDRLRLKYTRNVKAFVDSISAGKNFELVLGFNDEGNLLYRNPNNDITGLVIKGLNDKFEKENK